MNTNIKNEFPISTDMVHLTEFGIDYHGNSRKGTAHHIRRKKTKQAKRHLSNNQRNTGDRTKKQQKRPKITRSRSHPRWHASIIIPYNHEHEHEQNYEKNIYKFYGQKAFVAWENHITNLDHQTKHIILERERENLEKQITYSTSVIWTWKTICEMSPDTA